MRQDLKGTNHKRRPFPDENQDFGMSAKLHEGLGLDLVRFVNISVHLFGLVGRGKSSSSFSCCDKSKPDRTLTRTKV